MSYDLQSVAQIARRLEAAMEGFRATETNEFVGAMVEYAEVVRYCNERLLDAHQRLVHGNRSDAIEAIEAEPNVLDCLKQLDAVDAKLPEWSDTCDLLDIPRSERLLSPLAEELEQQYDTKHQLAVELRAHRLLAIGNGPLEQRVATLRRILRLDPENKFWLQDLVDYESHCQAGLRTELQALDRSLSRGATPAVAARIKKICEELADVSWQEPVDGAVIREAQAVQARVRRIFVREELVKLGEVLQGCHADGDERRVPVLMSQWQRLADEIGVGPTDPLAVQTDAVRSWCQGVLDRQGARDALAAEIGHMTSLISTPMPATHGPARQLCDRLRIAQGRVQAAAGRSGETAEAAAWIDAATRRISEIDRGVRAFGLLMGAAGLGVLAVVVAIGAFAWRSSVKNAVRSDLLAAIQRLRDESQHREVAKRVADESAEYPWLAADEKVKTAVRDVEREIERSQASRMAIDKAVQATADAIAEAAEVIKALDGVTSFGPVAIKSRKMVANRLAAIDTRLSRVVTALEDARKGVFLDGTGLDATIAKIRTQADSHRGTMRRWVSGIRDAEATSLKARIQAFDGGGDKRVGDGSAKISELESDIDVLEAFGDRKEAELREMIGNIKDRSMKSSSLSGIRRDLDAASQRGVELLLETLQSMDKRLADENRAEQASVVVASRDAVAAAMAWSEVANRWRPQVLGPRAELQGWMAALRKTEGLPRAVADTSEENLLLKDLKECLRQMAATDDSVAEELRPLEDYLDADVLRDDVSEVEYEGQPYYAKQSDSQSKPHHFVGENVRDEKGSKLNSYIAEQMKAGKSTEARHVRLVKALRAILTQIKRGAVSLDEGLVDMLGRLLEAADAGKKSADELLRARLLIYVANLAMSRHVFKDNKPLARLQEELASKVGEKTPWVVRRDPDPDKTRLNRQSERDASLRILEQGPSRMASIRESMQKRLAILGVRPAFCRPLEYYGWVDDTAGGLQLSGTPASVQPPDRPVTVYIVIANTDAEQAWQLIECGQLRSGDATLRAVDSAMFGRPAFVEFPPSAAKKAVD